jgi:hypothetical protein
VYKADGLTLIPHIPTGITRLEQRFPVRYGAKKLYLSTAGNGSITAVTVIGDAWKSFDARSVLLPYDRTPDAASVTIYMGGAKPATPETASDTARWAEVEPVPPPGDAFWDISAFMAGIVGNTPPFAQFGAFYARLRDTGLGGCYEARHAKLVVDCITAIHARKKLEDEGAIKPLPEPSQSAADKSYVDTAVKLAQGLQKVLTDYENSGDAHQKQVLQLWQECVSK